VASIEKMRVVVLLPFFVWWGLYHVKNLFHLDDICRVKNVLHLDDIYQMNIFLTRTTKQLIQTQDKQFATMTETLNLLRLSIDRVTEDVSTRITRIDQQIETLLVKTEEIAIRPEPNWKEVDDIVYLLKKEGGKMSIVLNQCHKLSQTIRDDLLDNRRLRRQQDK
jgi:hypothetical protein